MNAKPEMKKKKWEKARSHGAWRKAPRPQQGAEGDGGALRGGRGAPLPCDHAGVTSPWVWGHAPEFGARDFSNP